MKFFAILLCIAIGSVFGELQRPGFGKEKLEVTEDVDKARSPISVDDGRKPYSSDESLRGKYAKGNSFDQIAANTKDADSVEKKTSRSLSPSIDTSTVKPSSSKAIKKNLEIMHLGKPAKDFKELREITRRNSTESKTLKEISVNFLKMLLMSTDAVSHMETNLESNSREFLRRKRMAEVEDPTNLVESYKMYKKVREKLPEQLRMKTRKTDTAEEKILNSYATSNGDTSNLIANYNSAKSAEREQLKVDASGSGATEVIDNYKALRKGKPWNYIKLRGKLEGFFGKPSPSLTEYETLKQDEVASIDSFLGGSSNTGSERAKTVEPQEKEKPAEEKATNVQQPQEKEKPTEEKATNVQQPQEKEAPSGETDDWLSNERVEFTPVRAIKYLEDYTTIQDSELSNTWIDTHKDIDETNYNGSHDLMKSMLIYQDYLNFLNRELRYPIIYSDECESALLSYSADSGKFRNAYLSYYYYYRRQEIMALKAYLASKPENIRERILLVYKCIRKGKPWYWMKAGYKTSKFFNETVPEPAMDKYLAVKKEELYTDQYLDGSMTVGIPAPAKDGNMKVEIIQLASSQIERGKANRKLQAEVAQVARAEEDEKSDKMERGERAKETETVEVEYDAYRENVENIVATSDDAKEDVEVHGSPDNVTSADVRNTETTTDTKINDNSHLLRFAILFAMVMQVIIAILILAPQRDKLVEWCKSKNETESGPGETEPLNAGEKVFATGPTSKVLKVSSQRRPDVADANQ